VRLLIPVPEEEEEDIASLRAELEQTKNALKAARRNEGRLKELEAELQKVPEGRDSEKI
jgi:hypothetical protein